jgi:ABC-type dipeptide transport system, periplasmic component
MERPVGEFLQMIVRIQNESYEVCMMKKKTTGLVSLALAAMMTFSACSAGTAKPAAASSPSSAAQTTKVSDIKDQMIKAADPSKSPDAANKRTDTFVATIHEPGGVFLPNFYDNGWDGNAVQPIFSTLVTTDESGNPIPDLAEKWEISSDGLTYTYYLRPNLKFSDGSPLTADDVAFTLTLFNDPAYAAGDIDFSDIVIKGTDEYKKGSATSISGIKVINPTTIQITTEKPNPLSLTTLGGFVLSKAYYGKDYQKGKLDYLKALYSKPMGDGPYQLDQYVNGQEVRYNANPNYYGGKPAIAHLIFKVTSTATALQMFQAGETDFDSFSTDQDTLDQLKSLGFANINIHTVPDYGFIYVNSKKSYLSDTAVRQALIYGLDRQQIVDIKYKGYGEVANVFGAPTLWSYTEDGVTKYNYDPEKAKQLLASAGWKAGSDGILEKDGQKLKLSYLTTKPDDQIIPVAKEDYTKLGIEFTPEVLDSNTLSDRLYKGDYDLVSVRSNGLVDPNDAVREFASTDPNVNVSGYSNPTVTKLAQQGISTSDKTQRQAIYKELYQELSKDPPAILIDYRKSVAAWNDRIDGGDQYVTGDAAAAIELSKLKIKP